MKHILIPIAVLFYTFIVYKATVFYHYDIKDHIIYGEIRPYDFMNDGDLARIKLHKDGKNNIDSVTLNHVTPNLNIEHPTMGSMHIDFSSMQLLLRDRRDWIQFNDYDEIRNYISSRFPSDEYDH